MISFRYYLDTRRPSSRPDGCYALKLQVNKRGQTALMPVAVWLLPEHWDAKGQRVARTAPQARVLNNYLDRLRMRLEDLLRELILTGEGAPMSAFQVRDWIAARTVDADEGVTFLEYYRKVADEKSRPTRELFQAAWAAMVDVEPRLATMDLASIDDATVRRVDAGIRRKYAMTTRNAYIAKLTQVTKRAHAEGLIQSNPGRLVHLHYTVPRARALTAGQLRTLFDYVPETRLQTEALAFFKLSFYLRAMNPVDIARTGPDAIYNGRIRYTRAKTGKDYDFPVEPEAQALLDEWGDADHLFAPLARVQDYQDLVGFKYNQALGVVSRKLGLPRVSMYWARHTLASLIIETGGTMELAAGVLGHSYGPRVTAGYVTLQERQVEEAVRRVYDLVAETENPPGPHGRGGGV